MKKVLFLTVISIFSLTSICKAQQHFLEWSHTFFDSFIPNGWPTDSISLYPFIDNGGRDVAVDNENNSIVVGYWAGLWYDMRDWSTLSESNNREIFIRKCDAFGKEIWAKHSNGVSSEDAWGVSVDQSNNIIVCGSFRDSLDFDFGPNKHVLRTSNYNENSYVLKLDEDGNLIFAKHFDSGSQSRAYKIATDDQDNIYVVGQFRDFIDLDPDTTNSIIRTSNGELDSYIIKLDANGEYVWGHTFGGDWEDRFRGLYISPKGSVYISGFIRDSVDLDPSSNVVTPTTNDFNDAALIKLNSDGSYAWSHVISGPGSDYFRDIAFDGTDILIIGEINSYRSGPVNLNPNGNPLIYDSSKESLFVQKLDTNGIHIWSKVFAESNSGESHSLVVTPQGEVFVAGAIRSAITWNPNSGMEVIDSSSNYQGFITLLSNDGQYQYTETWKDGERIDFWESTLDQNGRLVLTGIYEGVVDFDLNDVGEAMTPTLGTGLNGFLFSVDLCKSQSSFSGEECEGFVSPSGKYTWMDSGQYKDTLTNSSGCDSVITFDLILSPRAMDTVSIEHCGSYTSPSGLVIDATGTYSDTYSRIDDCDSLVIINATIHPEVTSRVEEVTACGFYEWIDGQIYTANNDTASLVLTDVHGCDSIIELNLNMEPIDATIAISGETLMVDSSYESYAWLDCDQDYTVIVGANGPTFSPKKPGNYAVRILNYNCEEVSDCIPFVLSSNSVESQYSGYQVFPNPSSEKVFIQFDQIQRAVNIRLFDMSGKSLLQQDFANTQYIDVLLPEQKGFYFLTIHQENGSTETIKLNRH